MRVAPAGLAGGDPFSLGCQAAALTHGHPSGYLAAGALALMVSELIRGHDLRAVTPHLLLLWSHQTRYRLRGSEAEVPPGGRRNPDGLLP